MYRLTIYWRDGWVITPTCEFKDATTAHRVAVRLLDEYPRAFEHIEVHGTFGQVASVWGAQ